MKTRKAYNPFSSKNALLISVVMTFFIYAVLFATTILTFSKDNVFRIETLYDIIISIIGNILMLYLLFRFSFYAFQKKLPPFKKYLFTILGQFGLTIVLSLLFSKLYSYILSDVVNANIHLTYKNLMLDLIYSFIVLLITISISEAMKNQRLGIENQRNRNKVLKNQLDPHFLFNSLNVLDGLISLEDTKAHDYIQNLSFIFRNTIQNKEITELNEEMELVEAYSYLMKIRYGDSLDIQYKIDEKYRTYLLPHVSLQLLVENAIKHNTANHLHPLSIIVETTPQGTIKVTNNKNPKIDSTKGSGIGLKNIAERYKLEFKKNIRIEDNASYFSVEMPLIEQIFLDKA